MDTAGKTEQYKNQYMKGRWHAVMIQEGAQMNKAKHVTRLSAVIILCYQEVGILSRNLAKIVNISLKPQQSAFTANK